MSKKNGCRDFGNGGNDGSDYEIGYKKPPLHTRWKKGQSGNTKGRPKKKLGPSDIARAFDDALSDSLAVNDNGTVRKIKKLKAFAIQTVNKALKGHHPSANLVMGHYARRAAASIPDEPGSDSTTEAFKEEMEALLKEIATKSQPPATRPSEPEPSGDDEADPSHSGESSPETKH